MLNISHYQDRVALARSAERLSNVEAKRHPANTPERAAAAAEAQMHRDSGLRYRRVVRAAQRASQELS